MELKCRRDVYEVRLLYCIIIGENRNMYVWLEFGFLYILSIFVIGICLLFFLTPFFIKNVF